MACLPRPALTPLRAILCFPASPAFCKLPREAFPDAAAHIGALPDATAGLVLAAGVAHDDAGPVLDIGGEAHGAVGGGRGTEGELFDEREDVVGRAARGMSGFGGGLALFGG